MPTVDLAQGGNSTAFFGTSFGMNFGMKIGTTLQLKASFLLRFLIQWAKKRNKNGNKLIVPNKLTSARRALCQLVIPKDAIELPIVSAKMSRICCLGWSWTQLAIRDRQLQ